MRYATLLFLVVGCSSSSAAEAPEAVGAPPPPSATNVPTTTTPPPCDGQSGTFHDVAFESGGETRHYWLHVPASYSCTKPAALVVDFHGTGFGSDTDTVEESWATPELTSASDDLGFLVVRPRSRMKQAEGGFLYQWDINPGDVAKNKAFATELVAELRAHYNVQDTRVYATGFSNGPNMAAQFLGDEPSIMHGYGLVSGGLNAALKRSASFGADAPRIYTMTGFRDYMLVAKDRLASFLGDHAYPAERRFEREADTGHEVYGWHFREMFAWMDRGERPAAGTLRDGWTREAGVGSESIVEIGADPSGALVAVGAAGGIYARTGQAWTARASLPAIAPLSDICFTSDGRGFVAGHGRVASSADGKTWTVLAPLPEFGSQQFGYTHVTTVGCSGARVTAGGVWSSATSNDGGATWAAADMSKTFTSAVRATANGWLAAGYWNYTGRSSDGLAFEQSEMAGETQWWNDVGATGASSFAVGEAGAIATDHGNGWSTLASSATKEDLYAVAFRGSNGVAVGAHGTVIVTKDSGATWSDRSTGLDVFLGGVRFVDDTTFVVGGGGGTLLRGAI